MANLPQKLRSSYVVTQSNELIEADYSKSNLTVNAMKIAKLVVAKISPNDTELRLVRIKNSEIKQYFGYKTVSKYNRFYNDVKVACERLNEQAISIILPSGNTLNAFFISSWEIDNSTDETVFEISGRLKPYLLQLRSNYTSYQLRNIPRLTSTYSIRFYELLCQYRRIGKRQFEVEDLKKKVGCSYPSYGHFKNKALLKAQEHLLYETDLRFEFEEIKTGRKITSILFYIYPNNPESSTAQQVLPFLEEEFAKEQVQPFSESVGKTFREIGISDDTLDKMLVEGFDIIQDEESRKKAISRCRTIDQYYVEKLTLLQQSKASKNPAGFFIKAIKEDWASPTLFKKKKNPKESAARKQQELALQESQLRKLTKQLESERQLIIDGFFAENPKELKPILKAIGDRYPIVRNQVEPLLLVPESYSANRSVAALVNVEVERRQPESFIAMEAIKAEIEAVTAKIKAMQ